MAKKQNKNRHRPRGYRPFWSGVISFGLVNVPVELFPSVRSNRVSLRMLDDDGTPLSRRYYNPETDNLVESEDIVRGYELDNGEFVIIDDDELAAIDPKKSREIDLRSFVKLDDIPPLFFDRSYFLTPDGDSNKAYRLLANVMQRTGRAGIASFVMRGKEYLVAILAEEDVLRAQILRFEEEIRSPGDVGLPEEKQRDDEKVNEYRQAIQATSKDELDPNELKVSYSEELRKLAEKKHTEEKDIVKSEAEAEQADDEQVDPEDEAPERDLLETIRNNLTMENGAPSENGAAKDEGGQNDKETDGLDDLTKDKLYEKAQQAEITGRSKMKKADLIDALRNV